MRVMFKDSYGSIGTTEDQPNKSNGRVYVTWNYGLSQSGEPITCTQGYADYSTLIRISEEHYQEFISCLAWSEQQKTIRAKIIGAAEFNESKKCRECANWCADPDDEYCGHPEAMKITQVGVNLMRCRGNIAYKPEKPGSDPAFGLCGPEGKLWEKRHESLKSRR